MKSIRAIKTFTDRYPLIGPAVWILSVQYYIAQLMVAKDWSVPFSLSRNTISDLGNTACSFYSNRFVCSPLHSVMNASFIMLGVTMALGSLLIYQEFREKRSSLIGLSFMAVAGVGTILVGLFPENTVSWLHVLGAALPFLIGNLSLIILGISLPIPRFFKACTLISGVVALIALFFFATHHYLGLGAGGMERITAYPQTLWLIAFGVYMSSNHIMQRSKKPIHSPKHP